MVGRGDSGRARGAARTSLPLPSALCCRSAALRPLLSSALRCPLPPRRARRPAGTAPRQLRAVKNGPIVSRALPKQLMYREADELLRKQHGRDTCFRRGSSERPAVPRRAHHGHGQEEHGRGLRAPRPPLHQRSGVRLQRLQRPLPRLQPQQEADERPSPQEPPTQ